MRLVCPHCGKAHLIKNEALAGGRSVRCSACKSIWHAGQDGRAGEVLPPQPLHSAEAMVEKMRQVAPSGPVPPLRRSLKKGKGKKAAAAQKRHLLAPALLAGLAACLVLSLIARESVVRQFPDLAGLYAQLGLPVNLRHLEFMNVEASAVWEEGAPQLILSGKVVNVTRKPAALPSIMVSVRDATGLDVHNQIVSLEPGPVEPDADIAFQARVPRPPADARSIHLRFIDRAEAAGG